MRRGTWFLACLLAACSASPAAPATTTSPHPSGHGTVAPASADASATGDEPGPIGSALPVTLTGIELHTFAVGEDVLDRMAAELGVMRTDIEVAFASDHGARFVQMYALRLRGTDAAELAATWADAAFPPDITDVSVSEGTIAGRMVTIVESASLPSVGTYYLDPRDDILIVVQAFDVETATEALAAVP
jgi:hypothetical protein